MLIRQVFIIKNKRDWVGLVGGGVLIVSLFMPWISAGDLSQKAIDIKYGYVLLFLGALACLIALISIITKTASNIYFAYQIISILSALVLYQNYVDLARRAQSVVNNFPFLTDLIRGFIGPGVYVGMIGCLIMFGSVFLKQE